MPDLRVEPRRLVALAIRAAAIGWVVFFWVWLNGVQSTFVEVDAQAYWGLDLTTLYDGVRLGDRDAFLYSPAVALLFAPFSGLPYEVFYGLLAALNLGALVWILGWELAAVSLFLLPVSNEVARGNIHLLLAAAIVIGFRRPGVWAWVILTKVTPGIGVAWFAVRHQWRALVESIAVTSAIALTSFVVTPDLWWGWFDLLARNAASTRPSLFEAPVFVRLGVAGLLLVVGAWRNRPAIVPVAALLALPAIWVNSLAMLVAVVPLWRHPGRSGHTDHKELLLDSAARTYPETDA